MSSRVAQACCGDKTRRGENIGVAAGEIHSSSDIELIHQQNVQARPNFLVHEYLDVPQESFALLDLDHSHGIGQISFPMGPNSANKFIDEQCDRNTSHRTKGISKNDQFIKFFHSLPSNMSSVAADANPAKT